MEAVFRVLRSRFADHDLFVEMRACDANLAQLAKERYERVGYEPLPTDEREMGPL